MPKPKKKPTPSRCHLRNEWLEWSAERRRDRIFMVCPCCGVNGSHVGNVDEPSDSDKKK